MNNLLQSISSLAGGVAQGLSKRKQAELDARMEERKMKLLEDQKMHELGLKELEITNKQRKLDLEALVAEAKKRNEEDLPVTAMPEGPLRPGIGYQPKPIGQEQGLQIPGTMRGLKALSEYIKATKESGDSRSEILSGDPSDPKVRNFITNSNQIKGNSSTAGITDEDYDLIVDKMAAGEIPPPSSRNFTGNYTKFLAAAAKKNINVNKITLDYDAVKTHLRTVNGRMQLQIRQSASTATEGLDYLGELVDELDQLIPRFGATPLNKIVTGGLTKELGLTGQAAQVLASQVATQIADLIPEMANVYSAGGVPTDRAMKLSGENLNKDWSTARIKAGIKQAKKNLGFRIHAITSTPAYTTDEEGDVGKLDYPLPTDLFGKGKDKNKSKVKGNGITMMIRMKNGKEQRVPVPNDEVAEAKKDGLVVIQ